MDFVDTPPSVVDPSGLSHVQAQKIVLAFGTVA